MRFQVASTERSAALEQGFELGKDLLDGIQVGAMKSFAPAVRIARRTVFEIVDDDNVPARGPRSPPRRAAIESFAQRAGSTWYANVQDAAVSGADPIGSRAGFTAPLDRIEGNGIKTVIVEDASRLPASSSRRLGILAFGRDSAHFCVRLDEVRAKCILIGYGSRALTCPVRLRTRRTAGYQN
jgi:hypothetical protein